MVSQFTSKKLHLGVIAHICPGRRTLASPISRSTLRQLSTETSTDGTDGAEAVKTTGNALITSWPTTETQPQGNRPQNFVFSNHRKKQKVMMESIVSLSTDSAHNHQGRAWAKPHKIEGVELAPVQQWKEFQRIQKNTRPLGTKLDRRYSATNLVNNPPGPENVTLELLMASQTHMGHHTSMWNPNNSRYIYGVREGIHIISLETTAAHLRRAARVVEEVAYKGGLILIVGTRKGQMEIVTKAAELAGACHVFTKWTPGAITNRDVILKTAGTKIVNEHDRELDNFDIYANTARPLMPDLVVCLNPKENYTLLYECGLKSIPTIGVIDTDADPSWVTYTIPANDDRSVSNSFLSTYETTSNIFSVIDRLE